MHNTERHLFREEEFQQVDLAGFPDYVNTVYAQFHHSASHYSRRLLVGYLKSQDVPMVIVSHDREFLDQLCNKLVETEHGMASTYKGNYTEYVKAKEERAGQQWAAWEKQQKEISRQVTVVPNACRYMCY